MNVLKLDTNVPTTIDSSPSAISTASCPSPIAQSDSTCPSFSRQSSQSFTLETASTSSLPTPTVKFAPLPSIGPRKRRSNQPLGMAARAQLVRKRRGKQGQDTELVISSSPMWTSTELDEQRLRIEAMAARHAEFQARENAREVSRHRDEVEEGDDDDDEPRGRRRRDALEDGVEDPILIFGKIVKVAGKTLWKRVAKPKEVKPSGQERRRELSPLPILIKSIPPEPAPPTARPAYANAQIEPRQESESPEPVPPTARPAYANAQIEPRQESESPEPGPPTARPIYSNIQIEPSQESEMRLQDGVTTEGEAVGEQNTSDDRPAGDEGQLETIGPVRLLEDEYGSDRTSSPIPG